MALDQGYRLSDILSPRILLGIFFCWVALRFLFNVVRNLTVHPLASFPGPKLAAASRLYEFYWEVCKKHGGQFLYAIDDMHDRYGPIVRVNPYELHIKDLDFYEQLYALGQRRDKATYMADMFGTRLSLFGSEKYEVHRQRRLAINSFFSKASTYHLEPIMREKANKMTQIISKHGNQGNTVNLNNALIAVTIDLMTQYSFNKCANALDSDDFSPVWTWMMAGVSEAVPIAKMFPGIVERLRVIPLWVIRRVNPLFGGYMDYEQHVRTEVSHILNERKRQPVKDVERLSDDRSDDERKGPSRTSNVFEELLRSSLPEHEKSEDRFTQEGVGFISAAAETTGIVLVSACYHVIADPEVNANLKKELDELHRASDTEPPLRVLEQLPYLTGVVKEALRISVPVASRLPLISPDPMEFNGRVIPPNTVISMSPRDALLSPDVFPDPLLFKPQRWINAKEPQRMEKALLPFNRGPRMCLGQHLARAQLYMLISKLFSRFRMELHDVVKERDIMAVREAFVSKPTKQSKGLRVNIVTEYS